MMHQTHSERLGEVERVGDSHIDTLKEEGRYEVNRNRLEFIHQNVKHDTTTSFAMN